MKGKPTRRAFSVAAIGAAVLLLAACGSGLTSSGTSTAAPGTAASSAAAPSAAASSAAPAASSTASDLPSSLLSLFTNSGDSAAPASLYANFKAVPTPWKICFEDGSESNTVRVDIREQIANLAALFEKAGKVSSFQYSVSNNSSVLENSQLRTFIQQKCSVILLTAGSTTGDIGSIKAAYQAGIPVVAVNNYINTPYAINVVSNRASEATTTAQEIVNDLHGQGTVVFLQGIAGDSVTIQEDTAAAAVWAKNPGIKIIVANGNFAAGPTSEAMQQVLATHPGTINAVWSMGNEVWYIEHAFAQAGRPIPIITGLAVGNTLALAHSDPSIGSKFFGPQGSPAVWGDYGFDTAVRILSGEDPKSTTIMLPWVPWTGTDISGLYASCMTQAGGETPIPNAPAPPLSTAQMNAYFTNGHEVAPFNYQSTLPSVC